jgi:hypothetical protein
MAGRLGSEHARSIVCTDASHDDHGRPEVEQSNEPDLNIAWGAEIYNEPSYEPEPEPEMPEATAEI